MKLKEKKLTPKKEKKEKGENPPGEPRCSLSSFYKREIFKHLQVNGCSEESLDKVLSRFSASKTGIVTYFNELMSQAETYLYQECSSLCFDNIEAWLNVMKMYNLTVPTEAFAEYLDEIAEGETLPEPEDLNGINLRDTYHFLSNAMLGLPQPALNPATAEFLSSEMESLIEEINNEAGDEVVYAMFEKLRSFPAPDYNFNVLDPFDLNTLE